MNGRVYDKRVVAVADVFSQLVLYQSRFGRYALVVGDRTGSREFLSGLERHGVKDSIGSIHRVDEHLSSLEARSRYFKDNPPTGFRRWIPLTMQTPPVPFDDYVAVILAERFLSNERSQS